MCCDDRRGGGFGAFLLGGMLGAVLGLLFAPRSGKESRDILAGKAEELMTEGKDLYETGREKVVETYATGRTVATEKTEELREKLDVAREKLKEQVGQVSGVAKEKAAEVGGVAKDLATKVSGAMRHGADAIEEAADGVTPEASAEPPLV
ncbi:MAG: YtxH domain-containing protein [Coriobacteriia bacterium]